jgi:hypothetical protein
LIVSELEWPPKAVPSVQGSDFIRETA